MTDPYEGLGTIIAGPAGQPAASPAADPYAGLGQVIAAPAAQPAAPPEMSTADKIKGGLSTFVQGMTFGLSDELAGGLDALRNKIGMGGAPYEESVNRERETLKRFHEAQPKTAAALEFGGSMLPGAALAPLGMGSTVASTIGRSALLGGAEGAAYGAATGETPEERAQRAAVSGVVGLATGAAVPAAVEGVRAGYRGLRSALTPQSAASADIRRAIARDQLTPPDLIARAREMERVRPGEVTLADVGGENVRGQVERIAQTPGVGRAIVVPRLTTRQQQQSMRLADDLRAMTGSTKSAMQALEQSGAQQAAAAQPLYQQAYAAQLDPAAAQAVTAKFAEAVATPLGKKAWRNAQIMLRSVPEFRGAPPDQIPLTAQIDYWHRSMQDMAGSSLGEGNLKRALTAMRHDVVDALDVANPAFKQARAAWAGPAAFQDAVETGRGILGTKVSAEEFAGQLAKMSPSEAEGVRIGAVSAIVGKMRSDPAKMADFTKYLRSPEMRDKVAALMPTPQLAAKWQKIIDAEIGMSELGSRALGNSATARRLAERQDADMFGELAMDALQGTSFWSALLRIPGRVGRTIRDTMRSRTDAAAADILMRQPISQALQRTAGKPPIGYAPGASPVGPALIAPTLTVAPLGPGQRR